MVDIIPQYYSFNTSLAMLVGVEKSVIVSNICFWVAHNQANEKHFHDGRYWTFNSSAAFHKQYPFWSQQKIKNMLKQLVDDGYLLAGSFNKTCYDHTKWYSPSDEIIGIYNSGMAGHTETVDCTKLYNQRYETVPPIPYIKTDVKKDNNMAADDNEKVTYSIPKKKPSLEDIEKYIALMNYNVDAVKFFEYYESLDWHDKNGKPVKNWKLKMRVWNNNSSTATPSQEIKPAQRWVNPQATEDKELDRINQEAEDFLNG